MDNSLTTDRTELVPVAKLRPSRRRWISAHNLAERVVRWRFQWAGLEERMMDLGVARIRYWIGGNGPPLVLLHGFGGDGLWAWHGQIGALAKRHRIIVPDLVFFGQSTSESTDRSLYFQSEVVTALAARLDIDRFDVCGISYGGLVGFTLAAMYHQRVRRLVMVDSPGPTYTLADHQKMLDRFGVSNFTDLVIPKGPEDVRRLLELAWTHPPPTPAFVLQDTFENVFSSQVQEKVELLDWLDAQRTQPELRTAWEVPQPTLLVWGENDPLFPLEVAERFRDALETCELVVIPGARHAPNVEKPTLFNDILLEFLKR
jgi:pimeloyl-ACP methyl ester carboxylesterase